MIVAWYVNSSGALRGNLYVSIAAIVKNHCIHCEMSVIGSAVRPGPRVVSSTADISAISTNSRSRIFLTVVVGRAADGRYGPVEARCITATGAVEGFVSRFAVLRRPVSQGSAWSR